MKVKQLIESLRTADPERIVILQKDPEGNSYAQLDTVQVDNAVYQPADEPSEAVKLERLTRKLAKDGYTKEDVLKEGGQKCIVLIAAEEDYP
ncbi:MAG: hypothetical protein ABIG29_02960 [Candidatus Nealsonbacteria bacterium]